MFKPYLVGEESNLEGDEAVLRPGGERVEHVEEHEGREGHGVVPWGHLKGISFDLFLRHSAIQVFQESDLAILQHHVEDEHGASYDDCGGEEHVPDQLL